MGELTERLYRTWVEYLLSLDRAAAAIAIDSEFSIEVKRHNEAEASWPCIIIALPTEILPTVMQDKRLKELLEASAILVTEDYVQKGSARGEPNDFIEVEFTHKLVTVEDDDDWEQVTRRLISEGKQTNQGLITEKIRQREGRPPLEYNEMKFASKSEIRIAQELENRKVLFFPLALAVRVDTGIFYRDHREIDFLICHEGTWGILEVAFHPDRYEKDKEKDAWFKKSGILCIEHYTAERCYNDPADVVNEFLDILSRHRR